MNVKMSRSIPEQIKLVDEGHFEQWTGMTHEWTQKIFESLFGSELNCSNGFLSGKKINKCMLQLKLQRQPLQIFTDDIGKIKLLRVEDVRVASSLKDIIQLLGEPEFKRSLIYPDMYSPANQWVYASKGITLYVLNENSESNMPLSAVALYEPTTVDNYLTNLGGKETMRFFSDD
jgi:hypothetical protein